MLSSLLPRVSGTDKGGNLPSRVLGHDHYIPNKEQLSNPPSEEKKKILEDFKNLTKHNRLSHLGLLFSGPLTPRASAGPALCYHILLD